MGCSVGAVERDLLPCQELDPISPVFQHIDCLSTDSNKCIVLCSRMLMFSKLSVFNFFLTFRDWFH
jgi:hypothetical protein